MNRPLCFVLMPFDKKPDGAGGTVDFNAVYDDLIAPAVEEAGLEALRADEEQAGGIIHKPMFERLIMCEYAVADLTTANANVFYELGVRHAVRPWSTVLTFAEGARLPFDVAPLRALPYRLLPAGVPKDPAEDRKALVARLNEVRDNATTDSPIFQLVDGMPAPQFDRSKTDVFREQVRYSAAMKEQLAQARQAGAKDRDSGLQALRAIEGQLAPLADAEAGVVIDLFLSYRAMKAWEDMIELVGKMSPPLAELAMVQEQVGLALNRAGHGQTAEDVLKALIARRGPSSETYGILGRVYKDRFDAARSNGDKALARGLLDKAIDAYLKGFEADWRDAYPGINAVTLMDRRDPPDPRQAGLLPVVAYAVERRLAGADPDYWDHATQLELSVLGRDQETGEGSLADALAVLPPEELWMAETTANNLRLIREARAERGDTLAWADEAEKILTERAVQPAAR